MRFLFVFFLAAVTSSPVWANCSVYNNQLQVTSVKHDGLYEHLRSLSFCPESAEQFRHSLLDVGVSLSPTMVANRGFHNPEAGSFSIFEIVRGTLGQRRLADFQLTFGHFVEAIGNQLQLSESGSLLIEAIAWDFSKLGFNFYELIASQDGVRRWFYRGDSKSISDDLVDLHLQSSPALGRNLRCSGCHMNGGPIMKELSSPHNDWWTAKRPLPFGGRKAISELATILPNLVSPDHLAKAVITGSKALLGASDKSSKLKNMQQALRPLFCAVEINLTSSNQTMNGGDPTIEIPTGFLVDPWWQTDVQLFIGRTKYYQMLTTLGAVFPENKLLDADHAWLTPVRSWTDTELVNNLIREKVVTTEFVADVLAIDFVNPLFSAKRCKLLGLVPKNQGDWLTNFAKALNTSLLPEAALLLSHLTNAAYSLAVHKTAIDDYLHACQQKIPLKLATWLNRLGQLRKAVFGNVISTSPGGEILEPGFRVIFPSWPLPAKPLQLNRECAIF